MSTRVIIISIIWLLIDLYAFQAIKTISNNWGSTNKNILVWSYWVLDISLILIISYLFVSGKAAKGPSQQFQLLFGLMILSLAPKLIMLPFLLVEDIGRGIIWISKTMANRKITYLPERRKIISQISLGIAAIPFLKLLHGITFGKYNFKVHKVTLKFKDLPEAFDGFKITQLSDIHSGSLDNKEAIEEAVELANNQKSDIIVFTGDLVNNIASEMDPWIETFKKLKAPMGQFSILGNHDYGDYIPWKSEDLKSKNLENVKAIHEKIGFKLLLDENIQLKLGNDQINLLGVENWGLKGFHKYGNLQKAKEGTNENEFNILLSHDPTHWEAQILPDSQKFHLTLSGHTHGMQFGIEIPGFRWSPSQYIYKQWAGAYHKNEQYIYVNRGFGFLGYPGRAGIYPEITVIELKRG
ncbi:MAG: metallophosphoesterase [Crocinitomicaceae bacterium]